MSGLFEILNEISGLWAAAMWAAVWQSSILASGVYITSLVFKRLSPSVRYWLWMIVGLRLLVMPFVTVELPVLMAIAPETDSMVVESGATNPSYTASEWEPMESRGFQTDHGHSVGAGLSLNAPAAVPVAAAATATPPALSFTSVLLLLWCVGLAVVLARLSRACIQTRRCIKAARFGDSRLAELAGRAADYFGMIAPPQVGITEGQISPFVYGVWSPVVILPRHLAEQADDEQLMVILVHELAHVRRRDALLGWAFALCHALYFFHPVLPFVRRQLLLERERACDEWVLALSKATPSAYARILVAVAALCGSPRNTLPVLVASESFQDLKTRLQGLGSGSPSHARVSRIGGLLLVVFAVVVAPGVVLTQQSGNEVPPTDGVLAVAPDALPEAVTSPSESPLPDNSLLLAATVDAPTPSPRPALVAGTILHFPATRIVGTVRVKDADRPRHIDSYYHWTDDEDWDFLSPAVGNVAIPQGTEVWLELNGDGCGDLAFLKGIGPDAIYRLSTIYGEENDPNLDDEGMAQVATLSGLRYLELRFSHVTDRGLAHLKKLPKLERLSVPRKTTNEGLAHIARVPTLQALYIKANQITDKGLVHIEALQELRELELGGGAISDAGLVHLTQLPKLDYLLLWGHAFGDGAMRHVAEIPHLTNLNVSGLNLSNRGIQHLAGAPKIEVLNLYGVEGITGLSLQYLADLKSLRMLNLSSPSGDGSRLTNHSMSHLAAYTNLESLEPPRIIDDGGLAHLAQIPNLMHLNLYAGTNTTISDEGLAHVGTMTPLRSLVISGSVEMTDAGLESLSNLSELRELSLLTWSGNLTGDGVVSLGRLKKLRKLDLSLSKSDVPLSALSGLNTLTNLTHLDVEGFQQDGSILDLSPLQRLKQVALNIEGGLRDDDVACLAGLDQLRWVRNLSGVSDAGVAHLAGLTRIERLGFSGHGVTDQSLASLRGMEVLDTLAVGGSFTDEGLRNLASLKCLHWLTVNSDTPLSGAAQERLVDSLPNLTVYNSVKVAGAGGR